MIKLVIGIAKRIIANSVDDFFIILFLTFIVATTVSRLLTKYLLKPAKSIESKNDIEAGAHYLKLKNIKYLTVATIYFLGISLALLTVEHYKPIATALLAFAGVFSSLVTFAARDSVSNLVAGITISFTHPLRVHDYVKISDEFGQVKAIKLMHTIITTLDNRDLVVPNTDIVSKPLRNYSLESPDVLAEALVPVPYTTDLEKAKKVIKELIKESPHYNNRLEPEIRVHELKDELMVLRIFALAKDAKSAYPLSTEIKEGIVAKFPKCSLRLGKTCETEEELVANSSVS